LPSFYIKHVNGISLGVQRKENIAETFLPDFNFIFGIAVVVVVVGGGVVVNIRVVFNIVFLLLFML